MTEGSILAHRRISIRRSIRKLLWAIVIGLATTALFSWSIFLEEPNGSRGIPAWVGWFGFASFASLTLLMINRLAFGPRIPLELSPEGILYRQAFQTVLPWQDISHMRIDYFRGRRFFRFEISEEVFQRIELTQTSRFFSAIQLPFEERNFTVAVQTTEVSFKELDRFFRIYLEAHNPGALE